MELYHLRSFIAVANEGHLTRAAQQLYISQPAVSAHIKALEEELGVTLFARTPQGMILTSEGTVLKAQAEKSLNTINELFRQAKRLQHDLTGTAKIGLNIDPELLKTAEFFSVMSTNYPLLEYHFLQRSTWEVVDELRRGEIDGGYMYGGIIAPQPDIVSCKLRNYNVMVVGPARWKDRIEAADWEGLAAFPWVWTSKLCAFCDLAVKTFHNRNLTPAKAVIADHEAAMRTLVISGVGLTLMREDEARKLEAEGKIVIWHNEKLEIELHFAYLRARQEDPVIQAILNGIFIIWNLQEPCI